MNLLSTIVCALLIGCGQNESAKQPHGDDGANGTRPMTGREIPDKSNRGDDVIDSAARAERVRSVADSILGFIKRKEAYKLARFMHSEWGVRFSPYGYVDTTSDIRIEGEKHMRDLEATGERILWGSYDGSGDSIFLDLPTYLDRFVYDADFLNAERIEINAFIGGGNSLNNLLEVYPDCDFIEYHFSGFDEKYGGMDWRSLRLVFRTERDRVYLIGIVHDEWTI